MPVIETSRAKIVRLLERDGWFLARHGGGHGVYRHVDKAGVIVVPRHRTLSPGVARTIARTAGWL